MKIEGYFTAAEVRSAKGAGAIAERLPYKKLRLSFPSQAQFDGWLEQQKRNRPDQWALSFTVLPRA